MGLGVAWRVEHDLAWTRRVKVGMVYHFFDMARLSGPLGVGAASWQLASADAPQGDATKTATRNLHPLLRFVLLSESDIPLYDPLTFWTQLQAEQRSRVNSCPHPGTHAWRWSPAMATPSMDVSHWRKSSQASVRVWAGRAAAPAARRAVLPSATSATSRPLASADWIVGHLGLTSCPSPWRPPRPQLPCASP